MSASLLLYCRSGFEKECAQEITDQAISLGVEGYVKAKPDSGYLLYVSHDETASKRLRKSIRFDSLIFPRQCVHAVEFIDGLPVTDRANPIADLAARLANTLNTRFGSLVLETADTNEAKELSSFCRKFEAPLTKALSKRQILTSDESSPRLHVFFVSSSAVYLGITDEANRSPWPMGIPRLRSPAGAPSRSAQKLAEALHVFLSPEQQAEQLHEGITAVDLGAAPGGWTWVLAKRGVQVTAIDNGALAPALQNHPLIEHLRADGLHWRPKRPVHWLVCDMAEQPAKVAQLMGSWLLDGHCQAAIFNLKLPMKRRYEEVKRCEDILAEIFSGHKQSFLCNFRQLYHDREEVTGYLRRF